MLGWGRSAHGAETPMLRKPAAPECHLSRCLRPSLSHMVGKTEAVACAHLGDGYSLWLFRLSSYGKAASPLEDADARSPRPRACDFRRLRFARNASFRRSFLESFLESLLESLTGSFFGSVAGALLCPSRLRFSSFIVDLFSCAERMTERIDAAVELSANIGKWQLK